MKHDRTVEILMETVVVAAAVSKQQRRRTRLARGAALVDEIGVPIGEGRFEPEFAIQARAEYTTRA
jgi:hypothetical protein